MRIAHRPLSTGRALRVRGVVEELRASLWFIPALFVGGGIGLAVLLTRVTVSDGSWLEGFVFPSGADSARSVLQAIAGSVITVTGVVFSLTVVTLQLASTQFSPRLLRTFLRDLSNQLVLGTFLATFAYSLFALRAVHSGEAPADDVVPALAVTGAYVLAAASVAALVYFIDHIARSIRIDSLMREVNEDTLVVIDLVHPVDPEASRQPSAHDVEPPAHALAVAAPRSGFVQSVDDEALLRIAVAHDLVVRVETTIGDRVIAGAPVAWRWHPVGGRAPDPDVERAICRAVRVGYERTMQQDVAFGFRQLVDVAVKALSPGVNDPTTAVHALGHLAALLTVLAGRIVAPLVRRDAAGVVRVVVPVLDVPGYIDLACGQIRRYGAAEPAVTNELLRLLRDLARHDLPLAHARAVARQADMVVDAAERSTPEPRDLEGLHRLHGEVHALVRG